MLQPWGSYFPQQCIEHCTPAVCCILGQLGLYPEMLKPYSPGQVGLGARGGLGGLAATLIPLLTPTLPPSPPPLWPNLEQNLLSAGHASVFAHSHHSLGCGDIGTREEQ